MANLHRAFRLKSTDIFTSAWKLPFAKLQCSGRRRRGGLRRTNNFFLGRSALGGSLLLGISSWSMCDATCRVGHLWCFTNNFSCNDLHHIVRPSPSIHPLNHQLPPFQPLPPLPTAPPHSQCSSRAPPMRKASLLHLSKLLPTINSEQNSQSYSISLTSRELQSFQR